ncbi:MAG: hypothetical protein LLG44_13235, partial [Chloroflexi bacterium]|nr:hypothetical protein [Chloroflexota bacterium]
RKDADYQLDQRIVVGILNADDLVLIALRSYGEYLRQETLAVAIVTHDDTKGWDQSSELKLLSGNCQVSIRKA